MIDAGVTILEAELRAAAVAVLDAAGAHPAVAQDVSDALVEASLRGIDTHGIVLLPRILARVDEGRCQLSTPVSTSTDFCAVAVLDAHLAPGQHAGMAMAAQAVKRAEAYGVGMVSVRNSTHFGAATPYVAAIVRAGMVGFVGSNSAPSMAAFGATGANLGNNPFAFGAPASGRADLVVDASCGVMSFGRLNQLRRQGLPVPDDAFVPNRFPAGSAVYEVAGALEYVARPFGAHKGASIAVLVETLSGVLSGGNVGHRCEAVSGDTFLGPSHFALAFNPKAFDVRAIADEMASYLSSVRGNFPDIRLPGEKAEGTMAERRRDGIPLGGHEWRELQAACQRFGVMAPEAGRSA